MGLINKLFQKQIAAGIQDFIKKTVMSTSSSLSKWVAKYGDANGNQQIYIDAYKSELYVYGCVYLIANAIASLPLKIYQDVSKNGKIQKRELTDHPAYKLFIKPNFKDSFYDVKESIASNLEITGNAYLLCEGLQPTSVYSLISSKVKIIPTDKKTGITSLKELIAGYEYGDKKGDNKYTTDDILHEKRFSVDDEYYGMSPIQAAALTIDTTTEAKKQNYQIFKQGMNADGSFESEQPYNANAHTRLSEDLKQKYSGPENAHKTLVLWNGLKYKSIGISPRDLQYIEGLKLNREELCGFLYQVPLILLGILENASYNNLKEATKQFYHVSIIPRLIKNQELYQKLIDRYGVAGAYCEFDLSGVDALHDDSGTKIDRAQKLWSMGVPYNEIAEAIDLPVKNIEGGDVGYLPFSVSPIGSGKKPPVSAGTPVVTESIKVKELNKIVWTEERKIAKWKIFDDRLNRIEQKYRIALNGFFNEQEKEVIDNLSKLKSLSYEKIGDNAFVIYSEVDGHKKAINIDSALFDYAGNLKKLKKTNIKYHMQAAQETGQAEVDTLGVVSVFDVTNPRIVDWLQKNSLDKATTVLDTDKEMLKQILIEGVNEGKSIPEIMNDIHTFYAEYETEAYKTERIARTEILGASNEGALESYQQSGVEKKGWLATRDDRTRDTHAQAEIDYADGIPIDEMFVVGGDEMMAPGQGSMPEETINCRCSILPIIPIPGE